MAGGSGVDVLTLVGGVPLLVRAVEGLIGAGEFTCVHVLLDPSVEQARVADACVGLPVVVHPHAVQRGDGARGNGYGTLRRISGAADAVVVHDVARCLAPAGLVRAVIAGLRAGHDVVVPVLPLSDTVKEIDADGSVGATPDRATLRVVQTPQAFRSTVFAEHPAADLLKLAPALAAAGTAVHAVAGDPLAFAIRSTQDARLAELLQADLSNGGVIDA